MTLQQLKYFIAIANNGSINKAAEQLFIAQPSLSASLKELERELNLELFFRTSRGIDLTVEGIEFLGYARQVVEQTILLEEKYLNKKPSKRLLSVSTQHYAFAVNAFVNMVKITGAEEYEFTLKETQTHEIIEEVKSLKSELGILYLNDFNAKVIGKLLKDSGLVFNKLFNAKPHIFTSSKSPLAKKQSVTLLDLNDYPHLSFEQGENNSFYFSEEILSTESRRKAIKVSDRATIFNLMIGLNGYTISTGIVSSDLNGEDIVSIPLQVDDTISVGYIVQKSISLTAQARLYLEELKKVVREFGVTVSE